MDKGRETGRIRGYSGEAFCFGFLDRTAADIPASPVAN
jgi:hypothetical protein